MARRTAAVLLTLGCLQAGAVSALGLGELTLDSFLNEPFKARVDLLNAEGLNQHQIRIRLATSDDFDRMGVDRAYFLTSIIFEVEIDDKGRGKILLSSEAPVLEPYLDFIVEARWPSGRLLREYTVLVDPPVFQTNQTVTISASETVGVVEGGDASDKKKSQGALTSSGTRVKVAKSTLAQGEMPQRDFGSDASHNPLAGNRYMIRRDETLWGIAQKSKPEGVSVHQTMLDIQRLNPAAFISGNINNIKAGYIIYLPASGDISSDDMSSALAEVRQQNQDWRDGKSSEQGAPSGGSLRISTERGEDLASSGGGESGSAPGFSTDLANLENLERSERDLAEVESRLGSMAEQVNTLERIVSVKDEQIAALQNALAEANAKAEAEGVAPTAVPVTVDALVLEMPTEAESALSEIDEEEALLAAETAVEAAPVVEKPVPVEKAAVKAPEQVGGFFSNTILYIVGLLAAIAVGAFVFMRRRRAAEEETLSSDDVFADIHLEEENLEVDAEPEPEPATEVKTESRGYGERKNDQYADDVDAGDALAEADIYIAYGRFPQAMDLLKTAVSTEPNNGAYKLKLMEVSAEIGDQAEVMAQYADLKGLGDESRLSAAEDIVQGLSGSSNDISQGQAGSNVGDLDLPLLDLPEGEGETGLEEEFGGLEIEGFETAEADIDDLDLSADFDLASATTGLEGEDEELIFAEDSDAMSTKLDLARAYLDMGDQDGARQIFEEVVAEGSEEQKEEARALLERLD